MTDHFPELIIIQGFNLHELVLFHVYIYIFHIVHLFISFICWYICIHMYNIYINAHASRILILRYWSVSQPCLEVPVVQHQLRDFVGLRPGTSHWCHWCRCWSSWRHQNSLMEASWWCLAMAAAVPFGPLYRLIGPHAVNGGRSPTFKCLDGTWRNPSCYSTTFSD